MARFLIPLLVLMAVCAAKPTEIQSSFLREVMAKLSNMRARSLEISRDDVRLATGLTVMSLVQKCEMYLYMNDLDPMELVANYYFHKNHTNESVMDHACPVVVLIVKEYMDADGDEELNAVTDSLLPLMEEAMCVDIVLNKELMTQFAEKEGADLNDRIEEIKKGEEYLLGVCEEEFKKGDANKMADDLLKKLTDGGEQGGSGDGA